jgi:hypothetical protein
MNLILAFKGTLLMFYVKRGQKKLSEIKVPFDVGLDH